MAILICPKCGAGVRCSYLGDLGAVDYYFTWLHSCERECGYREEFENYRGIGTEQPGEDLKGECPGCAGAASSTSEEWERRLSEERRGSIIALRSWHEREEGGVPENVIVETAERFEMDPRELRAVVERTPKSSRNEF